MQEWYNTLARTQNRSAETVSSTYKRQINNNSPYYQNQQGYVQNAPNQHQQVVFFAIMIFPVPEILYLIGIHTTSFWNIIIQRTSHDDLTEKLVSLVSLAKFVKWQECKTALCLTSLDDQIFKSFWKPNPWMNLLEKKIYYISFYSTFCRASPFLREWLALISISVI